MKRSKNHAPDKIQQAWEMRAAGYTHDVIAKQLRVPYWTLRDWFSLKTRVRLNIAASAKVGWRSWKLRNAQEHCA